MTSQTSKTPFNLRYIEICKIVIIIKIIDTKLINTNLTKILQIAIQVNEITIKYPHYVYLILKFTEYQLLLSTKLYQKKIYTIYFLGETINLK